MVAGVAALVVASAFAESRPSNETSWRGGNRGEARRDGDRDRDDRSGRNGSRNDRNADRNNDRNERRDDRRSDGRYDRRDDRRDDRSSAHQSNRQQYRASGRVSRVERYGSGYRVWVGSERYPFFVPSRYYNRDRFRIGVVINLGGYYNQGGYYDYYDNDGYSRDGLRGTVERVDHRDGTFVLRDDASGRFVTVVSREPLRRMRRGDFVEVYGDWARRGVFRADDVDLVDRY
jgi:hypothetical protein